MVTFQHNLDAFNRTLEKYAETRGIALDQALRKKGKDIAARLAGYTGDKIAGVAVRQGGFGPPIQANPDRIESDAKARGWRIKRRQNDLTHVDQKLGVSLIAAKIARDMMEGQKSQLFRVGGSGHLEPVRFGKSGSRRGKILIAKKGWRRSGVGLQNVAAKDFARASAAAEETVASGNAKRLNIKAIANVMELVLRKRAAKGGTLAAQWLTRGYNRIGYRARKFKSGFLASDALVEKGAITIKGYVPGVAKFPSAIAGVLNEARMDMVDWVRKEYGKAI